MQHLKNIKSGNPKTKEQYQLTKNFDVIWLWSEDGKNWYEEVKNFQPDTIKIVYDANNIIVAITKDASTLNPEGYSVVEVQILQPTAALMIPVSGCLGTELWLNGFIRQTSNNNRPNHKRPHCFRN
jgi:hypothetical protein